MMDQQGIFVKMALHAWQIQVDRATGFIDSLSEKEFYNETAPGKNRGIYLVGHLIAVHDLMPEILGFGTRSYPELQSIFLEVPDKTISNLPSVAVLKEAWTSVHQRLPTEFNKMPAETWFKRHESMTDVDFEKDPARNKLSVLLTRTNHLAYHLGQIRLLK